MNQPLASMGVGELEAVSGGGFWGGLKCGLSVGVAAVAVGVAIADPTKLSVFGAAAAIGFATAECATM